MEQVVTKDPFAVYGYFVFGGAKGNAPVAAVVYLQHFSRQPLMMKKRVPLLPGKDRKENGFSCSAGQRGYFRRPLLLINGSSPTSCYKR
ncbi:hypothetical protein LJC19_07515 [Oxalobacter sp. OttesenSCG-928-P03]|nr:hypothetical protein [Oxalobacter sp. OttesenSCG-928-P03]